MLKQVFEIFELTPDIDLKLMTPNQSLARLSSQLITAMDQVIEDVDPQWIMVQGDTTTAAMGALAGFYRDKRVCHVEAGLRTYRKDNPFPEEVNRRLIDVVADRYYCPTDLSKTNLRAEGVDENRILVTGNTVVDALLQVEKRLEKAPAMPEDLRKADRLALITTHRREHFGEELQRLCSAFRTISRENPSVRFIFPVHKNPNVFGPVNEALGGIDNLHLCEPLDYLQLIDVMRRCELILTDSGGIQEEAPTFNVPVLILRETTERPEGVEAGVTQLAGTSRERIVSMARTVLQSSAAAAGFVKATNPYGDGLASSRIVTDLVSHSL